MKSYRTPEQLKREQQRELEKTQQALRAGTSHPVAQEIGDNNTNQYRKAGNSI